MATIQVRNVPDEVYRALRARAAAAGFSLQDYVLRELVRTATLRTPADLVVEVEQRLRVEGNEGFTETSSMDVVRADRAAH